jgi:hypothetical protein
MTNGYLTFLDYLELRRRVEKRLASGNLFLLHFIVFGVGTAIIGTAAWSPYYDPYRGYFINPVIGHWITLWSGILLAHGLCSFWRSGARAGRRDNVIEIEMRERLQADDMYLSDRPKDLFRLHGLLNDDIRKRAAMIPTLIFFAFLNACIWIPWTLGGQAATSFAWTTAWMLAVPALLSIIWVLWRGSRNETKLRKQLEQYFSTEQTENDLIYEREMRLSNDNDELITVDEYMMKRKRS